MKPHIAFLKKLGAYSDFVVFADNYETLQAAWDACQRGEWSLWLLGKLSGPVGSDSRKKLVGVCAEIAELVLPVFEKRWPKDTRVRECINTCKRYSEEQTTIEELRNARNAAAAVADVANANYTIAYSAYAAAAAYAAAYAAHAGVTAFGAAGAAGAAASYFYASSSIPEMANMQQQCADLIRKHYPPVPKLT